MTSRPHLEPERVRLWGKHAHGSPLYAHLVEVVAADPELMRVLNLIEHTPRQNMLFAGVQYLMMRDSAAPDLAAHYASLSGPEAPIDGVDDPFREFVLGHEAELVHIGRTRYTQTNECRRCTALLPAIWESGVDSLHLVDVGTSAGLNLMLDRYHYRWDGLEWGPDSPVELVADLRGRPPLPSPIEVLSRTGLDLKPLDPTDPDDRLWLDALIWPEHHERRERLRAALDLAATVELALVAGSALDTLAETLDRLPAGEPAVVMHSFTAIQFTAEQRDEFAEILDRARSSRPVIRLQFEFSGGLEDDWPELTIDDGSEPMAIGQAHPHGEWLELYARP